MAKQLLHWPWPSSDKIMQLFTFFLCSHKGFLLSILITTQMSGHVPCWSGQLTWARSNGCLFGVPRPGNVSTLRNFGWEEAPDSHQCSDSAAKMNYHQDNVTCCVRPLLWIPWACRLNFCLYMCPSSLVHPLLPWQRVAFTSEELHRELRGMQVNSVFLDWSVAAQQRHVCCLHVLHMQILSSSTKLERA